MSASLQPRVLFLHSSHGSPDDYTSQYLKSHYAATVPQVSNDKSYNERLKFYRKMLTTPAQEHVENTPNATGDSQFDVLVGEGTGGACVVDLINEGVWKGPSVLCAPTLQLCKSLKLPPTIRAEQTDLLHAHVAHDTAHWKLQVSKETRGPIMLVAGVTDKTALVDDIREFAQENDNIQLFEIEDTHEMHLMIDRDLLCGWVGDASQSGLRSLKNANDEHIVPAKTALEE